MDVCCCTDCIIVAALLYDGSQMKLICRADLGVLYVFPICEHKSDALSNINQTLYRTSIRHFIEHQSDTLSNISQTLYRTSSFIGSICERSYVIFGSPYSFDLKVLLSAVANPRSTCSGWT